MNDALYLEKWAEGFDTACRSNGVDSIQALEIAQAGVDAGELFKDAADPVREFFPAVAGGIGGGIGANIVAGPRVGPVISRLLGSGSGLAGLLRPPSAERKEELGAQSAARALIPLQYTHNIKQRQRGVAEESRAAGAKAPIANLVSEQLGPLTSMVAPVALGGAAAGQRGALIGGGATSIAHLIAAISAGATKRRTSEEQTAADSSTGRAIAKYLVPGLSTYDSLKRVGKSRDWGKAEDKKDSKPAKAE